MQLTAVFTKVPQGYFGFVEGLPGANTHGETLEETRENLREAVEMVLEANRVLAEESLAGAVVAPTNEETFTLAEADTAEVDRRLREADSRDSIVSKGLLK